MNEDRSIEDTIKFLERMALENLDAQPSKVVELPQSDDNFYRASAARLIEAVLTVMTGIAIYKVRPNGQPEENEGNKNLLG